MDEPNRWKNEKSPYRLLHAYEVKKKYEKDKKQWERGHTTSSGEIIPFPYSFLNYMEKYALPDEKDRWGKGLIHIDRPKDAVSPPFIPVSEFEREAQHDKPIPLAELKSDLKDEIDAAKAYHEQGLHAIAEDEEEHRKVIEHLIYQKGLEGGQVQTEFPAKKQVIKPLGKIEHRPKPKKVPLDNYGLETSDRPHLESFGAEITQKPKDVTNQMKRVDKIIDEIDKCQQKQCGNLGGLVQDAITELKKLPILQPDEEIVSCSKKTMEKAKKFAEYVRSDYNKDRHIIATVGSFGITFDDDVKELLKGLECIGEQKMAEQIRKHVRGA